MDPIVYDVLNSPRYGWSNVHNTELCQDWVSEFLTRWHSHSGFRYLTSLCYNTVVFTYKLLFVQKKNFWFWCVCIRFRFTPSGSKKQKGKIIAIRSSLIFTSRWVSLSGGVVCTRHTQCQHKAKETLNAHILEIKERAICVKKITFWSQKGGPVYATQFTRAVRTTKKLNWNQSKQQIQTRIELFYVWRILICKILNSLQ